MKALLQNEWVRYVAVLLIGATIGAIFYPSKTITREETYKLEQKIEKLESENKFISKFFKDKLDKEESQSKEYREQVTKKTKSLKEENFKLKQKVSEKRFKIIRPDGTIEEKWFKDSETSIVSSTVIKIKSEFTRKVKLIENKWKKIHKSRILEIKEVYEKKLAETKTTKETKTIKEKIEINKRSFGISLGITTDKSYFSSISYDIYGPFFLDIHLESDINFIEKKAGVGLGIRF